MIPVLMLGYSLKVVLFGICLLHIGTYVCRVMLRDAGIFTVCLCLWNVSVL